MINPGLFWDDWVWIGQDASDRLRSGEELGVWWAGYFSNALYGSPHPTLLLHVGAVLSWTLAAAAFSYTLHVNKVTDRIESLLIFALICSCPISMIRTINSLAMYNVYIACFWSAFALMSKKGVRPWSDWVAVVLLAVSFHLSSLAPLFITVLALLFLDSYLSTRSNAKAEVNGSGPTGSEGQNDSSEPLRVHPNRLNLHSIRAWISHLYEHCRRFTTWSIHSRQLYSLRKSLLAPFLFLIAIKIPGMVESYMQPHSVLYAKYNVINLKALPGSPIEIARKLAEFLKDYASEVIRFTGIPFVALPLLVVVVGYPLVSLGLPKSRRQVGKQVTVGLLTFAIAVFPYVLVGKSPIAKDFAEERNILPALPGLMLVILSSINAVASLVSTMTPRVSFASLRNSLAFLLIGAALARQLVLGSDLVTDWSRQVSLINFVREHRSLVDQFSTVIIEDPNEQQNYFARKLWAYEYIGMIRRVYGNKDKLMSSETEYGGWPADVPILADPQLRRRFGLSNYDPKGRQLLLNVDYVEPSSADGAGLRCGIIQSFVYTVGYDVQHDRGCTGKSLMTITATTIMSEAGSRLLQMKAVGSKIEEFRSLNGFYPYTTKTRPLAVDGTKELIGSRLEGTWSVPESVNSVPFLDVSSVLLTHEGLQLEKLGYRLQGTRMYNVSTAPRLDGCLVPGCRFVYMSDGVDYKLLFLGVADLHYASHAFPEQIDPRRKSYGIWSAGAKYW